MRDRKNGFPAPKEHKISIRGGLFDSHAWNYSMDDPTKLRRAYTQAWGRAFSDAEVGLRNVPFACATIQIRRGVNVRVWAYGDTEAQRVLATVKKHDMVFILGQREQRLQHSKKRDVDEWGKVVVASFVVKGTPFTLLHELYDASTRIRIGLPKFLLFLWDKFKDEAIFYGVEADKPDIWESD